jgi:hypothetical protein
VQIIRNTRGDKLIPSSNMPRKGVSTVGSPTIELDKTGKNISVNIIPQAGPLFRLPLEIRRMIYNFVIGERILHVHHRGGPDEPPHRGRKCCLLSFSGKARRNTRIAAQELLTFRTKPSPLAFAATCQQIYQEAVELWYGNVRFVFHSVPCTKAFLKEIGDSNRNAIRHAGCNARWGPQDKVTKEILDTLSTFASLRSLTLENAGIVTRVKGENSELLREIETKVLQKWQEEAQYLLRLENRLESVTMMIRTATIQEHTNQLVQGFRSTWAREYRELKLNSCTGEIETKTTILPVKDAAVPLLFL